MQATKTVSANKRKIFLKVNLLLINLKSLFFQILKRGILLNSLGYSKPKAIRIFF